VQNEFYCCDLPDELHLDVGLGREGGGGGGEGEVLGGDEAAPAQAHHQTSVVHQDQVHLHSSHPSTETTVVIYHREASRDGYFG